MSVCPAPEGDRRFLAEWRRDRTASQWQQLRRREVILEVSDYIMRLRHAGRDAERWLDRLARLCGTTRPEWATRAAAAAAHPGPVLVPPVAPPSALALTRRHNKALRRLGQRPVDPSGLAQ